MTWYRVGPAGIPGSLKTDMDAVLNKKFGTSTTYAPNTWPDNVNLLGPLPEKTASGAIANITDGADGVPLKNWLVTLPASLDGYTEVNGTKNTGTGTPETQYTASLGRTIYGGTADIVSGQGTELWVRHKITADDTIYAYGSANGFLIATSDFSEGEMVALTNSGGLCEIDGTTFSTVTVSTTQGVRFGLANNSNIYFVQVYDVFGSTVENFKTYVTNHDVYVVYRLATPTYFTFTPITPTPETALGVNNFWADEGDSDVTYRADISLALQALGGGGRGLMGMMMQRPEEEQLTETEEDPEEQPEEAETNER